MSLRHYPSRLFFFAALSSLLLLGLCGTVAVYLAREQARTADVLGENIGSRRAAADLEATLADLLTLHKKQVHDVEPIQERVEAQLAEIHRLADKERERELADRVAASYRAYLALWADR